MFESEDLSVSSSERKSNLKFRRVLLKLSGEALQGRLDYGIDPQFLETVCKQIEEIRSLGCEVAVAVGGGNIWRGVEMAEKIGIDRATADYMGMLATVMNALAIQAMLEKMGIPTRVQTAIDMHKIAEPYIRRKAIRHLEKGRVVIFAAGVGSPFFTSDTAAALRAIEIGAEVFLRGTKVEGIYTADPKTNKDAQLFSNLTYTEYLAKDLKAMDATAVALCRENKIPIIVFNINEPENIKRLILGEKIGTEVKEG
ncbi:MAG: UMP kinase [Coprothermobacterota bacterium]|jgi:uridylate kinase|nr:UMP kinase [Caldisericota bacterium]MDI6868371.1 UMP kinase [Coprothermobacterota bacterium]